MAERAWSIPYRIKEIIGSFEIADLAGVSLEDYKNIFNKNTLHRLNDTMADVFFAAVHDIKKISMMGMLHKFGVTIRAAQR